MTSEPLLWYYCAADYIDSSADDDPVSDHLLPTLALQTSTATMRRGPWRAPDWLLQDQGVREWIQREAEGLDANLDVDRNPGLAWSAWKRRIRHELRARERSFVQPSLSHLNAGKAKYRTAMRAHAEYPCTYTAYEAEQALATLSEAAAAHRRHRQDLWIAREIEDTDSSTSFFFRPTTTNLNRVPISAAVLPNGEVTTCEWEVKQAHRAFWGGVFGDAEYSADPDLQCDREAQDRLLECSKARLAPPQAAALALDIDHDEIERAIKELRPSGAPGIDGLTARLYKIAPAVFARILRKVFACQLRRGELLWDQRRSVVVLLHKKGPRDNPGNFRPIALMCVDAKILARVLSNRLRAMLPTLIYTDQNGFIAGRHIQFNILTLLDIQDAVTNTDSEGYAALLDFEKAYDRVNHEYLWRVMRHFNIPENFIQWTQLLYKGSEAVLNINGWLQEPLRPGTGVKQGDPLSPFLFLLAVEPLVCMVRAEPTRGLALPELPIATGSYFADDATLFCRSLEDVKARLQMVEMYCRGSGARLNRSKTVILPLNRQHDPPPDTELNILPKTASTRYLGITVGQAVRDEDRVASVSAKFYAAFVKWRWRARTLLGRRLLAHAVILSQLWYCTTVTHVPKATRKAWQKMTYDYILRGIVESMPTRHLIGRDWLYSREWSTLRLPNITAQIHRQRVMLIQRLAQKLATAGDDFGWHSIPDHELNEAIVPFGRPRAADYLWAKPPPRRPGGHPGGCRCWSRGMSGPESSTSTC